MSRGAVSILLVPIALLILGRGLQAAPGEPSDEVLRSLVDGYAHAVETNNHALALWYVHPHAPRRSELDAELRDQLASHLERARTADLMHIRSSGGTISARVDQEVVRVVGLKLTRGARRSVYRFRPAGGSWRIWDIEEARSP